MATVTLWIPADVDILTCGAFPQRTPSGQWLIPNVIAGTNYITHMFWVNKGAAIGFVRWWISDAYAYGSIRVIADPGAQFNPTTYANVTLPTGGPAGWNVYEINPVLGPVPDNTALVIITDVRQFSATNPYMGNEGVTSLATDPINYQGALVGQSVSQPASIITGPLTYTGPWYGADAAICPGNTPVPPPSERPGCMAMFMA